MKENKIYKKFMLLESSQIPLEEVSYENAKDNAINPITGKPYKGIILFGTFADLSNSHVNNNKRYYDTEQYLLLLGELRKKVFDGKGVYGELEHPKGYAVNYNNVSHKILDVWYDPASQCVVGYVLLLDTETGRKAQEIVKSGGKLAISARAAGEELEQNDGSKMARVKLLTTYDLVCHPGFSEAVLDFKELNESQQFAFEEENKDRVYSFILYNDQVKRLDESYDEYSNKNLEGKKCFLTWLNESVQESEEKPTESQKKKEKEDIEKLQNNETDKEQELENKLKKAAQKDLQESHNINREDYYKRISNNQKYLQQKLQQGNAVYDDSAGFVTEGMGINSFEN